MALIVILMPSGNPFSDCLVLLIKSFNNFNDLLKVGFVGAKTKSLGGMTYLISIPF